MMSEMDQSRIKGTYLDEEGSRWEEKGSDWWLYNYNDYAYYGCGRGEHKYGADAFEEFMAKQSDKDTGKVSIDVAPVKKDEKSR